ncbi:MAG TPA: dihydrodipicolinate synthase family protein [Planctomycetaceae bacterium]|jgi:dihydrodipicolinate synthase/N-acetylneuraminate lyase|nr:dihydrodipicolinate synthase family protein [Planctomycetaceae bacterium]
MQTTPIQPAHFHRSVLAVPPLARDQSDKICPQQNARLIRHLEQGGVSMLLYGGNANLYHVRLTEYAGLLEMLQQTAGPETAVIPSVGPSYGLMMDQADVLKDMQFPTAMVLPTKAIMTEAGLMTGFRRFVQVFGRPAVLYIKEEGYISPEGAAELVRDGLVSFIKYAIVRPDPAYDDYLDRLTALVDPALICSGIGEQPAIVHLRKFGLTGFTSGCVCVNPGLSQRMLKAVLAGELPLAESIRQTFRPLEDLRNEINPIRVLHEAVALAGIAETGRHLPLLSGVPQSAVPRIQAAAANLLQAPIPG